MNTEITRITISREFANDDNVCLAEWHVEDGQEIAKGDLICTLESSKAVLELEAPVDGHIFLLKEEGQDLPVGELIAVISPDPARPVLGDPETAGTPVSNTGELAGDSPKMTGKARKLIDRYGLDVSLFEGIAIIREKHVRALLKKRPETTGNSGRLEPHSARQMRTAQILVRSKQSIPHSYLAKHVPAGRLEAVVQSICRDHDIMFTLSDWLVYNVARGLTKFEKANASWREEGLLFHEIVNLGFALNQADGTLIVPVIRDADKLDKNAIAGRIRGFQKKSIRKKLTVEDITGGHFTVTSLIGSGIHQIIPIIYPDQAGIVAIGDRWGMDGNGFYTLGLAFDHRILNGVEAAAFLNYLANTLSGEEE